MTTTITEAATLVDLVDERAAELGDEVAFVSSRTARSRRPASASPSSRAAHERSGQLSRSASSAENARSCSSRAGWSSWRRSSGASSPASSPCQPTRLGAAASIASLPGSTRSRVTREPAAVLTTSSFLAATEAVASAGGMACIATDTVPDGLADAWRPAVGSPESLALLQYTSGSTADPKGVMLTHANVLANQRLLAELGRDARPSLAVNWMPL